MKMIDIFAPLLEGMNDVIRNGLGTTREAIWKILLPIFAQLQFRNYWTEALVHVVNFTAVWIIAFREMMKRNCSISLSVKEGHDLAMDEFVEEHLVKPLKSHYVTGKSNCLFIYLILAILFFMYNVNDNVQHYVLM
jgi:nitrate/nitrite transporter NarK